MSDKKRLDIALFEQGFAEFQSSNTGIVTHGSFYTAVFHQSSTTGIGGKHNTNDVGVGGNAVGINFAVTVGITVCHKL